MKKETDIRKKNEKELKKAFREHLKRQEKKNVTKAGGNAREEKKVCRK